MVAASVRIMVHTRRPLRHGEAARTAARLASYRMGTRLLDPLGNVHNFTRRHGVEALSTLSPTPEIPWTTEPQLICDAAERCNRRGRIDHRLFREVRHTIDWRIPRRRFQVIADAAREPLVRDGMISIGGLHLYGEAVTEGSEIGRRWISQAEALRWPIIGNGEPTPDGPHLLRTAADGRLLLSLYQPHIHTLCAVRTIGVSGFGPPDPTWNRVTLASEVQSRWVGLLNESLTVSGHTPDLDPRTGQVMKKRTLPSRPYLPRTIFQINRRNRSGMHRDGAVIPVMPRWDGESMLDLRNILDDAEHQLLLVRVEADREREARVAMQTQLAAATQRAEAAEAEARHAEDARHDSELRAAVAEARAAGLARNVDDLVATHQAECESIESRARESDERARNLMAAKLAAEQAATKAQARIVELDSNIAVLAADAQLGAALRKADAAAASSGDPNIIAAAISDIAPTLAMAVREFGSRPADADAALAGARGAIAALRAAGVDLRTTNGITLDLPPSMRSAFAYRLAGRERLMATLAEAHDLKKRPTAEQLEMSETAAFSRGEAAGAERIRTTLQPGLHLLGIDWREGSQAGEMAAKIEGVASRFQGLMDVSSSLKMAEAAAREGRCADAADILAPQGGYLARLIRVGSISGDDHLAEVGRILDGFRLSGLNLSTRTDGALLLPPGTAPEVTHPLEGRAKLAGRLLRCTTAEQDLKALRVALDALGNAADEAALASAKNSLVEIHPGAGNVVTRLLRRPRSIDAAFLAAKENFRSLTEAGSAFLDDAKGGLIAVDSNGKRRPIPPASTETARHLLAHRVLEARPTVEEAERRATKAAEVSEKAEQDRWRVELSPLLERRGIVIPKSWNAPAVAGLIDRDWSMPTTREPNGGSRRGVPRWSCPEARGAHEMLRFHAGVSTLRPTAPDVDCSLRNAMVEAHNLAARKPPGLADEKWRVAKAEEIGQKHADRGQLDYAMASKIAISQAARTADRQGGGQPVQERGPESIVRRGRDGQ